MPPALTVVGAVASVVGAVGAVKSAQAQRKSVALQERQQQLATRESRRQAIRQAQIARSEAISAGANFGGLFGSSLQGGLSSLGSQVGGQLGFSSQMSGLSRDISAAQRSAARWGAISQLGFGLFNTVGGFNTIASGFNTQDGNVTSPSAALPNYRPQPNPSYNTRQTANTGWITQPGVYGPR